MIVHMENARLEKVRHSLAHLLAAAVLDLWPEAKPTIGPAIDNGFYYDFDLRDADERGLKHGLTQISEKDLPKIEKKMREILKKWETFQEIEIGAEEARKIFAENPYKLELIDEIISKGEKITLYYSGPKFSVPSLSDLLEAKTLKLEAGFLDLCKGGHVDNPSKEIPSDCFKLERLAGAYWRGDEKNKMLTRIYGLAFGSKKELKEYESKQSAAKDRDHRKIGRELDLFTFSDLVGSGLPLFTPKGQAMREAIAEKLWQISKKYGYQKVSIPHIAKLELYETSGHAEKFKDQFFYVDGAQSGQKFVMKPMNCPHHTQIYGSRPRSYRDLPLRFNELTMQYRDEKPGELLGLSRVRAITIDDAHLFCAPEQIKEEVGNIVRVIEEFYSSLGMWQKGGNFRVSLSVRDPKTPEKYLGEPENWDKAEKYLSEISEEMKLDAIRMEGEAAFYGPKLDFMFKDALGREWQLATAQIDFVQPKRFGLEYTTKEGKKETPVMLHRAVAGSLERFMAIMIEHFNGAFPFWLSPVQVKIIPVRSEHAEYAKDIYIKLAAAGVRAELDDGDENLGPRIRRVKEDKIPYWIVVGNKEIENRVATLESRDKGALGQVSLSSLINNLK